MAGPPGFEPGTSGSGGWPLNILVPKVDGDSGQIGMVFIPII